MRAFNHYLSPAYEPFQTTASDSALIAIVAARASYQRAHPVVKAEDLVIYTTTQTHSLGAKASLVLGLRVREIEVAMEDQLALKGKALRSALEEDGRSGLHPFVLSEISPPPCSLVFDSGI